MTESTQLNPCSVCGWPARLLHEAIEPPYQWRSYVICTNLDNCIEHGNKFPTPEEAVTFWNTRHAPNANND